MRIHLERIEPERGMARFYTVLVVPTLLGDWAVMREWGRVGQGGTVRDAVHADEAAAFAAALRIVGGKLKRGYRQRG